MPGEDFDTVLEILQLGNARKSRRKIADTVDIPISTVQNAIDRRKWYVEREQMAEV